MDEDLRKRERDHRKANAIYTIWKYFIISIIVALAFDAGLFMYRWLNGDIEQIELAEQPKDWVEPGPMAGLTEPIPYKPWQAGYYQGQSCYDEELGLTPAGSADTLNIIRKEGLKKELTRDGIWTFFICFIFLVGRKYILPKAQEGAKWVKDNK